MSTAVNEPSTMTGCEPRTTVGLVAPAAPDSQSPATKPPAAAVSSEDQVRIAVYGLLGMKATDVRKKERRRDHRYPFPRLFHLVPVGDGELEPTAGPTIVVGKHLSERGLGFFHPDPLPHRRMIATLEGGGPQKVQLLIDLSWCRFTKYGWYESGGRFLQVVNIPDVDEPSKCEPDHKP